MDARRFQESLQMAPSIDPVFEFVHEATAHFPRRKQRLMAAYYVRALQTNAPVEVRRAVPANLYPAVRHFLAESDWDHREVIWRAAARILDHLEVEWLACKVTGIARQWQFAWLAAYGPHGVAPLDLVLIGPTDLPLLPADYLPGQLDVLRTTPDQVLRLAPVAIGGDLAEDPAVRKWLSDRGVTYSAKVRSRAVVGAGPPNQRRAVRVGDVAKGLVRRGKPTRTQAGVFWASANVVADPGSGLPRETAVFLWKEGQIRSIGLTNESNQERFARCTTRTSQPRSLALEQRCGGEKPTCVAREPGSTT